jgi:hypothetical protein
MEFWFACKSLASSLCVKVRLVTQICNTSSQLRLGGVFHLLPVDSAVGGTKHCGRLGCEACGVTILVSIYCLPGTAEPYDLVEPSCLLRVDSASKRNKSRTRRKHVSSEKSNHRVCVCVCPCPYVCTVHSRLVQVCRCQKLRECLVL